VSVDDRHYLEVGSSERPERAADDAAYAGDAAAKQAGAGLRARADDAAPTVKRGERAGEFNPCATFAAIDFRGDRAPSDFLCVGERISNIFWQIVMLAGIIAGTLLLFSNCPAVRIPAG
jgi:hypothetical protein